MSEPTNPAKQPPAGMNILQLPVCMLEQVFEYLSYDEIAKKRIVCRQFNQICQSMLNRGFMKMIKRHNSNLRAIKSQLPRRESERRNHPLSKHSDILTCIETRISMLSMTYSKYIDKDVCCFIPGKVIDEVLNILTLIENTARPLRAHEVLQELRDISSMAIEHFDEHIAHRLKKIIGVHHHHHHPGVAGVHNNLHLPYPGFIQNEVVLPCDVNGEKLVLPMLTPITMPQPAPSTSAPSYMYYQNACNANHMSNASLMRIVQNSRRMEVALRKVISAMKGFKAQYRQTRLQMVRNHAEMKELRRRLDESETKNRELLANINQLSLVTPSTAQLAPGDETGLLKSRANIKSRSASIILKRGYPESDVPHCMPSTSSSSSAASCASSPSVPLTSVGPDDHDCDRETTPPFSAKKSKLCD